MVIESLPDPVRGWLERNPKNGAKKFWPVTDQQGAALDCPADILLLGGSAGSLKTSTILVDLITERDYSRMNSYFFRKTYPELEEAMQQAYDLFPQTGATSRDNGREWQWPSGAHFRFRHLSHEKNLYENQGKAMSAIGIDESTHLPMEWIRYLVTRNRSVDSNLSIRLRLGTNPGNISSKDHQVMFFNGVCPHCEPEKAPPQGVPRTGGFWHDGRPLRDEEAGVDLSIAYILSSVRDHNLLGAQYVARLKMQKPATAKALLAGCWRLFEGLYFDIWDYNTMVVPIQKIPQEWWQSWWVGADYGYSGSIAAAGLYTRTPDGVIYKVAEHPVGDPVYGLQNVTRENVRTFARSVYESFAKKRTGQEQARNIEAMYLGPDSWNDRGDEHTLAGQMNEELESHGLEFIKANNDRAGGAQLLYTMLESGALKISDGCPNTIAAIESRIHDEDEPVKIKKVSTDPLDDVIDECFVAGTLITTSQGDIPVERMRQGMRVLTRAGWKSILMTGVKREVRVKRVITSDGRILNGTGEHPVFVKDIGFIRLNELRYGDNLVICKRPSYLSRSIRLFSTESLFGVTLWPKNATCGCTSIQGEPIERAALKPFIARFTSITMGRFRKAITSTIKTAIHSTIIPRISRHLVVEPTRSGIGTMTAQHASAITLQKSDHSQKRGTDLQQDWLGTQRTPVKQPAQPLNIEGSAGVALSPTGQRTPSEHRDSVLTPASQHIDANYAWMMLKEFARSVVSRLNAIATKRRFAVPVHVVRVTDGGIADVYNLMVEGQPEYFANGILVHNCRYGIYSYIDAQGKPSELRIQDRMKKIMKQPGPMTATTALLNYSKIKKEEEKDDDDPVYVGGNARLRMRRGGQ